MNTFLCILLGIISGIYIFGIGYLIYKCYIEELIIDHQIKRREKKHEKRY